MQPACVSVTFFYATLLNYYFFDGYKIQGATFRVFCECSNSKVVKYIPLLKLNSVPQSSDMFVTTDEHVRIMKRSLGYSVLCDEAA